MNTFLLASPAVGAVWLVVLFIVVFLLVHALKLARLGLRTPPSETEKPVPKEPPKAEEQPKKRPARSRGSVYYIVEKKRKPKDGNEN